MSITRIGPALVLAAIDALRRDGIDIDAEIAWSESCGPPGNAEAFALETIFVICNSGMANRVARAIFARVRATLVDEDDRPLAQRGSLTTAFRHPGKVAAIDRVWRERHHLWQGYLAAGDRLAYCATLPWIGPITKYHLFKNFGGDVAKPDVHLERLAGRDGRSVQDLCRDLGQALGLRARTVDLILWWVCADGVKLLDSDSGQESPRLAAAIAALAPPADTAFATTRGETGGRAPSQSLQEDGDERDHA